MRLIIFLAVWSIASLTSSQVIAEGSVTVEWAPFIVKEGVTSERLLVAAQNVENGFLNKQKGYLKRSLLKGKDGSWVDLVYWQSEADANAAVSAAYESPICFEYFALMQSAENSEVSDVQHFEVVKTWD